jgi:Fe-S cluster assembly protein SufD
MNPPDAPPASPTWLENRRRAVSERLGDPILPSTDEEVWRYSRIGELDLSDWSNVAEPSTRELPVGIDAILAAVPDRAATVIVRNGFIVLSEIDETWAERGLYVGALAAGPEAENSLGSVSGDGVDVFSQLNDINTADPILVSVPRGLTVDAPVVLIDWIDIDGSAVYPRLVVRVGANADVRVLDWHGSSDVAAYVAPVVELDLAHAARLGYGSVQMRGPRVWQIASQVSHVMADATLTSSHVALGGDYARSRTDCRLIGKGATGNLQAIYFGENEQTLDFRTFQKHDAPKTTSNLLFKGAVDDHSRSVYTGLIKVEKVATGTNAFQTNRNLKLSEHAWAESVPNLEIETNDVKCSHASTVGPVDIEQLFYLESRGVPTDVAERLIVAGFFQEVLEAFPVPGIIHLVNDAIEQRLDRRSER